MAIAPYELIPYFLLYSYFNLHINIKQKHLLETQIGNVTLTQNSTMASHFTLVKMQIPYNACKAQQKEPSTWLYTHITQVCPRFRHTVCPPSCSSNKLSSFSPWGLCSYLIHSSPGILQKQICASFLFGELLFPLQQ